MRQERLRLLACVSVLLLGAHASTAPQRGSTEGEWRYWGADSGNTKYSSLDQIDAKSVRHLQIVWRRPAVDIRFQGAKFVNYFQSTPLMVGGVLYASNGLGLVEAFDPATGKTIWTQDPIEGTSADLPREGVGRAARGVAFWRSGSDARIFAVRDLYLYALDAKTGKGARGFGEDGRVKLANGRFFSPPLVCRDLVIVGSMSSDNAMKKEEHPGDVTAYDVRTGELRWTFHVVPRQGELGIETWKDDSWTYTGAANVWAPMSADEQLGFIYLPTSTPTADWYGGHRLGDNLFANSLVCVDATTGKRVWHFQVVHHDLWDYDLPAAPVLADLTSNGKTIKAVIQVTKHGFVFTFDRVTGAPVWPIEERPVPQSAVPGEQVSPTQPFPTKPPPFDRQGITTNELIDFTPALRAEAIELAKQYVTGPLFTPPSIPTEGPNGTKGTIILPGWTGGANWGGVAFDPQTGTLYVPSMTAPLLGSLVPPDPAKGNVRYIRGPGGVGPGWLTGPRGLPLTKPPYGRVTAIDMNHGEDLWMVPNGDGLRHHPDLKPLNLPQLGQPGRAVGIFLTKTLLFTGEGPIGGTMAPLSGGRMFRAYDKATGKVVWEIELPAGMTGAPMTYAHGGKQYIIVPIGGKESEGGKDYPAEFVALAIQSARSERTVR